MTDERRWGKLSDIDRRTVVGSEAWHNRNSENIQHLSAYRRLHDLTSHEEARKFVDESVADKVAEVKRLEERDNG